MKFQKKVKNYFKNEWKKNDEIKFFPQKNDK